MAVTPPPTIHDEPRRYSWWFRNGGPLLFTLILGAMMAVFIFSRDRTVYTCRVAVEYVNGSTDTFQIRVMGTPQDNIGIKRGDVRYWKAKGGKWDGARLSVLTSYAKSFKVLP